MAEFKLKFDEERPYVFVSYKSDDKEIVENSIKHLQEHYGLNIWYDADLTAGYDWDEEALPKLIDKNCQLVLFFASEKALCSPNVKKELDEAKYYEKVIIPINFSNISFDDTMRNEIARKYSKTNMQMVKTARQLIKDHLNEQRTYIYLHKSDYYEELIRSIKRITEKYDQNVFIFDTISDSAISKMDKTSVPLENTEIVRNPKEIKEKAISDKNEVINKNKGAQKAPKKNTIKINEKNDLIIYTLFGQEYSGNQSDLMFNVFEKVIERHPNKLDEIAENLYSVSLVDYEKVENKGNNMKSYFRVCKTFNAGDKKYCVGASLAINDKLYQIAKLLSICGENVSLLDIDGYKLPIVKTTKKAK